jgi:hypothetical protein
MTDFAKDNLQEMMARWVEPSRVPKRFNIVTDTSDFFRVEYDDVVVLNDRPYLCRNTEREGRFSIDDEPKFWVRRAVDLVDGTTKVLKMVFHEKYTANIGGIAFECFRSPKKEARILQLVADHPNFMQGFAVSDSAGNIVRVIDYIQGTKMCDAVLKLGGDHEDYFHNHFPGVLDAYIELVQAIRFLHDNGEKHGDIRRDHIIMDKVTGRNKWIDFDFNFIHRESMFGFDLFGLGNVIIYLTGRGEVTQQAVKQQDPETFDRLTADDMNIIFNNRIVNLRKIYPYIPGDLNLVLLHFSVGANVYYESTQQLLADLTEARAGLQ